jgi:CheY-like chemotaxis protein
MARVVAHVTDLLWGSKVEGMLRAAGHDVTLVGSETRAREATDGVEVLLVDLFFEPDAGIAMVAGLKDDGTLGGARVLGSYAHTAPEVRAAALEAGFDLVVPRSRMAREGVALVEGLAPAQSRSDDGT